MGAVDPATSVGVVGDVQNGTSLRNSLTPTVYKPMLDSARGGAGRMTMVVRSEGDPLLLVSAARAAVASINPEVPIGHVQLMEDMIADTMSRETFTMNMLVMAAVIALILGSVGIYGVISYITSQRTAEIGVRMTLGADSSSVRNMILMQGMRLVGIGVVIGLLGAAAMCRFLTSLLYGVTAFDPVTFVGGSVVFLAVGALASVIPALGAASTPPAVALQSS